MGGVWPVSDREAVEFRASATADDGVLWIGYTSIGTDALAIPVNQDHVRSFCNLTGYRICPGPRPNTVDFTFISHVDAKGSVPKWAANVIGPKPLTDFVADLQAFLTKKHDTSLCQ